jgi:hypothetical protein
MIGLLADHDVERHARLIWAQFSDDDWLGMQVSSLRTLAEAGIPRDASDRVIWMYCQAERRLLLTGNRNMHGSDSLEATIRQLRSPDSLPVLTIANRQRVLMDAVYRELCAYRIADVALNLTTNLGTDRLFLP